MKEKIAVLGTGDVGQALAAKFDAIGYEVYLGTRDVAASLSRTDPDSSGSQAIGTWIQQYPNVHLVTYDQAALAAEKFIFLAVNGKVSVEVAQLLSNTAVANKILIDVTNPLDFTTNPPTLFVCNTNSLGEQVQAVLPNTSVVKAFNTMNYNIMVNPGLLTGDHYLFMAGNSASAKAAAKGGPFGGLAWPSRLVMDVGDITAARGMEAMLLMWLRVNSNLGTSMFNWGIVQK